MPVMEGKAMLFKEFAGVDAFPLCLDTKDVDEIVAFVQGGRADVRRHQPRGHRRAALLRDRAAAARRARHPGLPRRPARHRDRRAGRAAQRAAGRRQAAPRTSASSSSARARPASRARRSCSPTASATSSSATVDGVLLPGRAGPRRRARGARRSARTRAALQRHGRRRDGGRRRVHRRLRRRARSPPRRCARWPPDAIVFAMANPAPEIQPEEVARRRRDHGHRALRLPEPDQQRARVPGHLPRRARRPRARRSTRR